MAFSQVCTNLCLKQTTCASNGTTSYSGYVYDPANNLPVPDVVVYVPNGTVQPFTDGPSSGTPITGSPLVLTTTNIAGYFNLTNMPVGSSIPLVIQAGKWQRAFTIPTVSSCVANTASNGSLGNHLTLPSTHTQQGNIPKIAIVTGGVSSEECVLLKMGVSQAEFVDPGGSGRIQFYEGDTRGGAVVDANTPAESTLWSAQANLNAYDVLLLPSQGSASNVDVNTSTRQVLGNFANAGGRVFVEHDSYAWLDNNPAFANTVNWNPGQGSWGTYESDTTYNTDIDESFSGGPKFASWINQATVYGGTAGVIPVGVIRSDFTSVISPTQRWLFTINDTASGGPSGNLPLQFTFDAPAGSSPKYGRVWFNDYLVEAQQNSTAYTGFTFPSECPTGSMTPQEKLFEYGMFDVMGFVGPPTATVSVANSPSTFTLGDTADTLTINVSDMSATSLDTSLTLTVALPTGFSAVSMAGVSAQTGWTCSVSTLECTRSAALAVTANDPILLTVGVTDSAGTGTVYPTATAAGGGLGSSVTYQDAVSLNPETVSAGKSSLVASPNPAVTGTNVTVTATVEDGSGNPIQGATVTFGAGSSTTASFSNVTATNAGGVATATLTDTAAETFSVSATVSGTGTGSLNSTTVQFLSSAAWMNNILWIAKANNSMSALSDTGQPFLSTAQGDGGTGVAIDSSGNVWSVNASGTSMSEFTNTGNVVSTTVSGSGLAAGTSLAIDGLNHVWVTNSGGSISVFNSLGSPVSATAYAGGGGLNSPVSIAIDMSGSLWIANSGGNSVTEVIGAAAPTVSLGTGVANGTAATEP